MPASLSTVFVWGNVFLQPKGLGAARYRTALTGLGTASWEGMMDQMQGPTSQGQHLTQLEILACGVLVLILHLIGLKMVLPAEP